MSPQQKGGTSSTCTSSSGRKELLLASQNVRKSPATNVELHWQQQPRQSEAPYALMHAVCLSGSRSIESLALQYSSRCGPKEDWKLPARSLKWGYSAVELKEIQHLDQATAQPLEPLPIPAAGPAPWIFSLHLHRSEKGAFTAIAHSTFP